MISCACPTCQIQHGADSDFEGYSRGFAGEDAAKELAKEPEMVPFNILNDYGEVLAKIQGVELGKSSASASSSKETVAVE